MEEKLSSALGLETDFLKDIDIYKVCTCFLVCGFLGWTFETSVVLLLTGQYSGRGFLYIGQALPHYFPWLEMMPLIRNIPLVWGLPFIEMYGFGGTLMVYAFRRYNHHPVKLFFLGMIIMGAFEFVGGWFCQNILHQEYWSYRTESLNFYGYVSLRSAITWGLLSVVAVKVFAPMIDKVYAGIKRIRVYKTIVVALMVYAVFFAILKYIVVPGW